MVKRKFLVTGVLAALLAPASGATADERPRGRYIRQSREVAVDMSEDPSLRGGAPVIIFLNRGGGEYSPGPNNSSNNTSSIIGTRITMPPNTLSDDNWQRVVNCVTRQFGRFNAMVTDVDPGAATHVEAIVSGSPADAGFDLGTGGVSPFTCDVIPRSIVYAFTKQYGNDTQGICETAAQEIAHSFGLDHEFLCEDPMTYLSGCGKKIFRNIDAQCGEYSARSCTCGNGPTQNSVQMMLDPLIMGPGETENPVVTVTSPADGAAVRPSFAVEVDATDNYRVVQVDLYIDDQAGPNAIVPDPATGKWIIEAPATITPGPHTLELRAYDPGGALCLDPTSGCAPRYGSTTITVNLTADCMSDGECTGDDQVCGSGGYRCVGDWGATCTANKDCDSDENLICGVQDVQRLCTRSCVPDDGTCPSGFECLTDEFGGSGQCWPGGGGGCRVDAGRRGGLLGGLAMVLCAALLVLVPRRRC